jgi:hypothetical protein
MLPIWWLAARWFKERRIVPIGIGILLVASIAWRDVPDYFQNWPQRGMTRFLYRADIHDVAGYLNENSAVNNFGITGLLAGPWDKLALQTDLGGERSTKVQPRWYNPERVLLLQPPLSFSGYPELDNPYKDALMRVPGVEGIGGYRLYEISNSALSDYSEHDDAHCFENGFCLTASRYNSDAGVLELVWVIREPLAMPDLPLISNPPPPGIYAGPRLSVFAHLQDAQGNFLVGDDGLWVDPLTLQPGDQFVQQHRLPAPEEQHGMTAVFGLYDPKTGERILTTEGQDALHLEVK